MAKKTIRGGMLRKPRHFFLALPPPFCNAGKNLIPITNAMTLLFQIY